jgi:hypothetical protein
VVAVMARMFPKIQRPDDTEPGEIIIEWVDAAGIYRRRVVVTEDAKQPLHDFLRQRRASGS